MKIPKKTISATLQLNDIDEKNKKLEKELLSSRAHKDSISGAKSIDNKNSNNRSNSTTLSNNHLANLSESTTGDNDIINQQKYDELQTNIEKNISLSQINHNDNHENDSNVTSHDSKIKSSVDLNHIKRLFRPYKGDLFGLGGGTTDGLLYLSRMNPDTDPTGQTKAKRHQSTTPTKLDIEVKAAAIQEVPESVKLHMQEVKRRFAISLATLSKKQLERKDLIEKDNAIPTLVKLSYEHDYYTQLSCAATYYYLSHETELCGSLLQYGITQAISSLSRVQNKSIQRYCAVALCNLAASDGYEAHLVHDGVVTCLLNMSSSSLQIMNICIQTFYNLSCVKEHYSRIEDVNSGTLHLAKFTMTPDMEHMLICTICNLSNIKGNQVKLLDEGVLNVITSVAKTCMKDTLNYCSKILSLLSSCSKSRAKLAVQRIIYNLGDISARCDDNGKQDCVLCITRLSMDPTCSEKIIYQGAIGIVVNLCSNLSLPLQRMCAAAICALSKFVGYIEKIISDNATQAIIRLIRSNDSIVRQLCAQSLCQLFQYQRGMAYLVECGALDAVVELVYDRDVINSEWCIYTFYSLSSYSQWLPLLANNSKIINAILELAEYGTVHVKQKCASTLWNVTNFRPIKGLVLIPTLVRMLCDETDEKIQGDCAAALYNLANIQECCKLMFDEGVLEPLIDLSRSDNEITKIQCAAILSRLSFQIEYRAKMIESRGCIKALLELIRLDDKSTQRRVIFAIVNLSYDFSARSALVELGAAKLLIALSNKPDEEIRRGCAAALCNFSFDSGCEDDIIKTGAISAILIIALVTSDSLFTKKICAKALINLLNNKSYLQSMINDGVIWGLGALCKMNDVELSEWCINGLCNLAASKDFAGELAESSALVSIVELLDSDELKLKKFAIYTLLNLFIVTELSASGVKSRIFVLSYLIKLKQIDDSEMLHLYIILLSFISFIPNNCSKIIENGLHINWYKNKINDKVLSWINNQSAHAISILLYNISFYCSSLGDCNIVSNCINVINSDIINIFIQLIDIFEIEAAIVVSKIIYIASCNNYDDSLSSHSAQVLQLIQLIINKFPTNEVILHACVGCLFNLSRNEDIQNQLVHNNIMSIILTIWSSNIPQLLLLSALTVCNLACGKTNTTKLVQMNATKVLSYLTSFTKDIDVSRRCSAAFRNLLSISGNQIIMVKQGAISSIIRLADCVDIIAQQNCSAALRNMTYNPAIREYLLDSNAMDVMMHDARKVGVFHSLNLSESLLFKIEAESWSNGSRGVQKEGRAPVMPPPDLYINYDLINETNNLQIDINCVHIEWNKYLSHIEVSEPDLDVKLSVNNSISNTIPTVSFDYDNLLNESKSTSILFTKLVYSTCNYPSSTLSESSSSVTPTQELTEISKEGDDIPRRRTDSSDKFDIYKNKNINKSDEDETDDLSSSVSEYSELSALAENNDSIDVDTRKHSVHTVTTPAAAKKVPRRSMSVCYRKSSIDSILEEKINSSLLPTIDNNSSKKRSPYNRASRVVEMPALPQKKTLNQKLFNDSNMNLTNT